MNNIESPSGIVIAIVADGEQPRALVQVDARAICPRCAEGKGCGAGVFGSSDSERRIEALVAPGIDLQTGDAVTLSLGSRNLLQAASIVYGWPLAAAAAAVMLASFANVGDAVAALAAILGLAGGAWLVRRKLGHADCLSRFVPTVVQYTRAPQGPLSGMARAAE